MQLSPHCEGVPIASPQVRMQHWRTAALGGHVPAMTHYAIGSGFRSDNTLQDLAALGIYRREAETMARAAAAAGDPLALMALRSEERRAGKECVRTRRSRGRALPITKQNKTRDRK